MEPSIVSARLIMSEIRTARVARNAFSTLIVPAIRVALVIDVSILVRELAHLTPIAGWSITRQPAIALRVTVGMALEIVDLFQLSVRMRVFFPSL